MNFNLLEYLENVGWVIGGVLLYPLIQQLIKLYKDIQADYDRLDELEDENECLKMELEKIRGNN